MTTQPAPLTWDVYVTGLEPTASDDPPPGAQKCGHRRLRRLLPASRMPSSSTRCSPTRHRTLPTGSPPAGKNLTALYITRSHGDHWFGLSVILKRFPQARAVALPAVVEAMRQGSTSEVLALWNGLFPDKIPEDFVLADPLPDRSRGLEAVVKEDLLAELLPRWG